MPAKYLEKQEYKSKGKNRAKISNSQFDGKQVILLLYEYLLSNWQWIVKHKVGHDNLFVYYLNYTVYD